MQSINEVIKSVNYDDIKSLNGFFKELLNTKVGLLSESLQTGPDDMPYLFVTTDSENPSEDMHSLLKWCYEKGAGLVLNPQRPEPDFIFTYGMVWNFIHNGEFLSSEVIVGTKSNTPNASKYFAGEIVESVWPKVPRTWLKKFLLEQGVIAPKAVLLSEDQKKYEIAFSIESLGSGDESEHEGILETFAWFFPRHYSLMLVKEKMIPEAPFKII